MPAGRWSASPATGTSSHRTVRIRRRRRRSGGGAAGPRVRVPVHGSAALPVVAGELVARRRVTRGRDEPATHAAGRPAPSERVIEGERTDAGAMAESEL